VDVFFNMAEMSNGYLYLDGCVILEAGELRAPNMSKVGIFS
jgi:hypothetical protein